MRRLSPVLQVARAESLEPFPVELPREEGQSTTMSATLLQCGVAGVLLAAPLFFGATSVYAGVAFIAAAWLLLAVLVVNGALSERLWIPSHPVAVPAVLLLGFLATHWLAGISVAPDAARFEWLKWLAYTALAVVAVAAFDTPQRMSALMRILALGGLAIALLAIAQHLTANGKIYWMIEPAFGAWAFGPYANRNHFAGLMELWMPLALGLALVPGTRNWLRCAWWLAAVAMSCAVILSGSRAGLLVLACEFVIFAMWLTAQRGRRALLAAVVTLALVVTIAGAIGGRGVDRFLSALQPTNDQVDDVSGNRVQAWRDTLTLFRQHWAIGGGLESFAALFPAVRTFSTDKFWSHAHNDYLQFLAEAGIAGAALAVWIFLAGAWCATGNLMSAAQTEYAPLLVALACACVGFLMHGWLDFNFHIPANAASFAVLAAVLVRRGWKQV